MKGQHQHRTQGPVVRASNLRNEKRRVFTYHHYTTRIPFLQVFIAEAWHTISVTLAKYDYLKPNYVFKRETL